MVLSRRAALQSSTAGLVLASFGCGGKSKPSTVGELASMDAVATAQAIKSGEISAVESINAAIERAEKLNPQINAIVTAYYNAARERAAAGADGAWFGVPSFIKDLNKVTGQRTTYGSRAFANYVAPDQSELVDAIFSNGIISLGKSSSPEFGLTATTESQLQGATRNPWNLEHSAGGSSGGAAALVAAGVTPIAHASDGGGSIRIPASSCGVVGLKPSRGRMPRPDAPAGRPLTIAQHGVESRTVRDTAAFLALIETDGKLEPVGLVSEPSRQRRRIKFFTNSPTGHDVHQDVITETQRVGQMLADLGHDVEEIRSPFDAAVLQDFTVYWGSGAARAVKSWEDATGLKADYNAFEPWTFGIIDFYESRAHTLDIAVERLLSFAGYYEGIFADTDLILSPVIAQPPPKIGYLDSRHSFPLAFERLSEIVCFTQFMNVSGAPAISLPTGMSSDGLPIGAQLAAATGNERTILEVAYELEEAMPWRDRKPAVSA
ncbi:MAG: amidase [Marinicaulis sp.]|nr:amidase [Marinicaulis sp.]